MSDVFSENLRQTKGSYRKCFCQIDRKSAWFLVHTAFCADSSEIICSFLQLEKFCVMRRKLISSKAKTLQSWPTDNYWYRIIMTSHPQIIIFNILFLTRPDWNSLPHVQPLPRDIFKNITLVSNAPSWHYHTCTVVRRRSKTNTCNRQNCEIAQAVEFYKPDIDLDVLPDRVYYWKGLRSSQN